MAKHRRTSSSCGFFETSSASSWSKDVWSETGQVGAEGSASDSKAGTCGGSNRAANTEPGMGRVEGKGFALDRIVECGSKVDGATCTGRGSDRNGGSTTSRFEELQERLVIVRVHELPVMPDFERIDRVVVMANLRADREDASGERCSSSDPPRRGPPEQ